MPCHMYSVLSSLGRRLCGWLKNLWVPGGVEVGTYGGVVWWRFYFWGGWSFLLVSLFAKEIFTYQGKRCIFLTKACCLSLLKRRCLSSWLKTKSSLLVMSLLVCLYCCCCCCCCFLPLADRLEREIVQPEGRAEARQRGRLLDRRGREGQFSVTWGDATG